jgi:hypothetical protein
MSLVFKPKFPPNLAPTKSMIAKAPKTNGNPFGPVEINDLIYLRAINMSYNNIGKRLHRSPATLAWVVCDKDLSWQIKKVREHIISEYTSEGVGDG